MYMSRRPRSSVPDNIFRLLARDLEDDNIVRLAAVSKNARAALLHPLQDITAQHQAAALAGDLIVPTLPLHSHFGRIVYVFHDSQAALRLLTLHCVHIWHFRRAIQAFVDFTRAHPEHSWRCDLAFQGHLGRHILTLLQKFTYAETRACVLNIQPYFDASRQQLVYSVDPPRRHGPSAHHGPLTIAPVFEVRQH